MNDREIKFRVWDCRYSTPEMFYVNDLYWFEEQSINSSNESSVYFQQLTGLVDKNGKEIYEGDVLEVLGFDDWFDEIGHIFKTVVIFNDGAFRTKTWKAIQENSEYKGTLLDTVAAQESLIIGNIYENPEFLK